MRKLRAGLRLTGWLLALALAGAAGAEAGEAASSTPAPRETLQPSAPGTGQGMGMVCPMMASMGSGMQMGGTNASGLAMNHGASPSGSLTDLAQNFSMRDILQIVQELVVVQERMLQAVPRKEAAEMRRDVDRLKDRSRELMTEIRGMISSAARGE